MPSDQRRLRKRDRAILSATGGLFSGGLPAFARFVLAWQEGQPWMVLLDVIFWSLLLAWAAAVVLSLYLDEDHPWGNIFLGLGLPGLVTGIFAGGFVAFVQ